MSINTPVAHPDLTALVLSRYLIRRSITPNPRLLEDGTLRYMIVASPNSADVLRSLRRLLTVRGLPYTCERVEFSVEDGCYVDFKAVAK